MDFFELYTTDRHAAKEYLESLTLYQNVAHVSHLLSYGAADGTTVVHLAAMFGDLPFIETVVRFSNAISQKDKSGKTPLDLAIEHPVQSGDVVRFLLLNTSEEIVDKHFEQAIITSDLDLIDSLISRLPKQDLFKETRNYRTPTGVEFFEEPRRRKMCVLCSAIDISLARHNPETTSKLLCAHNTLGWEDCSLTQNTRDAFGGMFANTTVPSALVKFIGLGSCEMVSYFLMRYLGCEHPRYLRFIVSRRIDDCVVDILLDFGANPFMETRHITPSSKSRSSLHQRPSDFSTPIHSIMDKDVVSDELIIHLFRRGSFDDIIRTIARLMCDAFIFGRRKVSSECVSWFSTESRRCKEDRLASVIHERSRALIEIIDEILISERSYEDSYDMLDELILILGKTVYKNTDVRTYDNGRLIISPYAFISHSRRRAKSDIERISFLRRHFSTFHQRVTLVDLILNQNED